MPPKHSDSAAYTRGVRQSLGMSQSQFSEASGIPLKALQSHEQGVKRPGYDLLQKYKAMEQRAGAQHARDADTHDGDRD